MGAWPPHGMNGMPATPAPGRELVAEIRPGVLRPNWSALTTDAGRNALAGRMAARSGLLDRWLHALDSDADRMWQAVLRFYAAQGRPPGTDELAATLRVTPGRAAALLRDLQQRDLVGLDPTSGTVTYAYPLAPDDTGHRVWLGGRVLNALCAIDALGIAEMFDADATVTARCRSCGDTVTVSTAERGRVLRSVSPALSVVWYDFAYAGSAAASCCPHIAFFCSDKHLRDWLDGQQPARVGARLPMPEALELGRAIFGPVMRAIERLAHNPRHP